MVLKNSVHDFAKDDMSSLTSSRDEISSTSSLNRLLGFNRKSTVHWANSFDMKRLGIFNDNLLLLDNFGSMVRYPR